MMEMHPTTTVVTAGEKLKNGTNEQDNHQYEQ
jgi:hypothetical protein